MLQQNIDWNVSEKYAFILDCRYKFPLKNSKWKIPITEDTDLSLRKWSWIPLYSGWEWVPTIELNMKKTINTKEVTFFDMLTLPETNSSPLKIGHPKRKGSSSKHPFSGSMAVSFREDNFKFPMSRNSMIMPVNHKISDKAVNISFSLSAAEPGKAQGNERTLLGGWDPSYPCGL